MNLHAIIYATSLCFTACKSSSDQIIQEQIERELTREPLENDELTDLTNIPEQHLAKDAIAAARESCRTGYGISKAFCSVGVFPNTESPIQIGPKVRQAAKNLLECEYHDRGESIPLEHQITYCEVIIPGASHQAWAACVIDLKERTQE